MVTKNYVGVGETKGKAIADLKRVSNNGTRVRGSDLSYRVSVNGSNFGDAGDNTDEGDNYAHSFALGLEVAGISARDYDRKTHTLKIEVTGIYEAKAEPSGAAPSERGGSTLTNLLS